MSDETVMTLKTIKELGAVFIWMVLFATVSVVSLWAKYSQSVPSLHIPSVRVESK